MILFRTNHTCLRVGRHTRRSEREQRPAISDDYMVHMYENTSDIGIETDPTSFKEAMKSWHSCEWLDAMKDEMKSMSTNDIWNLVEIHKVVKIVGCKLVYKTKHDFRGNCFKGRNTTKCYQIFPTSPIVPQPAKLNPFPSLGHRGFGPVASCIFFHFFKIQLI
jgi:hypothetical protein